MPMPRVSGVSSVGGTLGYNKKNIEELRDVINTTAQECGKKVADILNKEIIVPMSNAWFATEAVNYFASFKKDVAKSGVNIKNTFEKFKSNIELAGKDWAERTKNEVPQLAQLDDVEVIVDVSSIQKEDNTGTAKIIVDDANRIANNLENVEKNIQQELKNISTKLDASTSFVGGNQSQSIQSFFTELCGEIHKIFSFLSGSNGYADTSLKENINNAAKYYGDLATNISKAFNDAAPSNASTQ